MGTLHGTGEIVEAEEGLESESRFMKPGKMFPVEDDINRLFESIRISARMLGSSQVRRDDLRKKTLKRAMKVGLYQASKIEISEPISLKQALRGLSICQASEMAAMKRLSKPGDIKWSQRTSDMVKVSPVPERSMSNLPENMPKSLHSSYLDNRIGARTSATELVQRRNLKMKLSSLSTRCKKKLPVADESVTASIDESIESVMPEKKQKPNLDLSSSVSSSRPGTKLIKPLLRNKNLMMRRNKLDSSFATSNFHQIDEKAGDDLGPSTSSTGSSSLGSTANVIVNDKSRLRDKGEFSQSTNSSLGEYSSTSDESNPSSRYRPHMSKDLRWEAVNYVQKQHGSLNFRHFKMIRKLGGGDIGTVYLAELIGSSCLFALKVMDNEFLALGNKATRGQTEREILELLDHPFLPTLFAQFTTDRYSCFVTEYCPGGDLHVLRQKQPNKCFSEQAARFYAAELLLALEYLHMLGIVYRDLKPENILIREDGHIMLTDFDLSLKSVPNPPLLKPSSPLERPQATDPSCTDHICFQPCFIQRKSKVDLVAQVSPLPQLVVEPTSARSNSFVGTHEYLAPEIIKGEGHGSPVDWWTFGILLYELLYGKTPFKGIGNEDTLANVVSRDLTFPNNTRGSCHARDLIKSLLRKKPEKRLGFLKGAAEIKQHPFFEGLNWALIRCATPPELPRICNFRSLSPS